ncbi:MAG: GFA family protein [Gammaproteobacteria bacterium]|nr:GFA family protein [Gammaproteobacteria bacterium]MDH3430620.1 GFA family protein [Gammaproteobacteria bacterium]
MTLHKGGCHCGKVRFEVEAPAEIDADRCNCSICRMSGYLHLIVAKNDFRLVSGQDSIETYTFNTGVAQHYFCRHCGIKSFYVPRSHPDGISVNVNCLDPVTIAALNVTPFDGTSWEQNIHKLSSLSD